MTSSEVPSGTAFAAEAALRPRRRRPFTFARVVRAAAPYLLILPVVAVIAAILGYPLYHLARLSFQKYGLFELIAHHGTSVGWANYSSVLHDHVFWQVLVRTIIDIETLSLIAYLHFSNPKEDEIIKAEGIIPEPYFGWR